MRAASDRGSADAVGGEHGLTWGAADQQLGRMRAEEFGTSAAKDCTAVESDLPAAASARFSLDDDCDGRLRGCTSRA